MNKLLWWLIAGTRGGENRARIINLLHDRPYNANQIADKLDLDYKTVRHHLKVLEDNKLLTSSGGKYGAVFFLSPRLEEDFVNFKEIWRSMKE